MSDTPNDPVTPASLAAAEETDHPTPGCRWRGKFLVKEPACLPTGAVAWTGLDIDQMEEVLLVSARDGGQEVDKAWEAVLSAKPPNALLPIASSKSDHRRIDVYETTDLPTLCEWRSLNKEVTDGFLHAFVEALVALLERIHEFGVGHFNLRPDVVFVDAAASPPHFLVGGWESATLFRQRELIPLHVDPLYAPPEAVDLAKHAGGGDLRLWDWWSLGRSIQELLLGHTVVSLLQVDGKLHSVEEMRHHAEELLRGKTPDDVRSGAVEAMGEIGERRRVLLKGLLTTAIEGRWTEDECRLWLQGQYPKEHYLLGRKERCFRFEGEFYTIAEAARALNSEGKWKQAWQQLMLPDQADTLAAFVREHAAESVAKQCDFLRALGSDVEFADFPKPAVEEAILALLLLVLAGGDFYWRGTHVNLGVISDNLAREDGEGLWLGAVWALSKAKLTNIVGAFDTEAARILSDLGKLATKATNKAHGHGWILQNNLGDFAKVWKIACLSETDWNNAKEGLKKVYACSRTPAVQRIFQDERPSAVDSVLLTFIAANPAAFGFVTHEDWAREECRRLHEDGMRIAMALLWRRLRRTFRLSPLWFGGLPWLLAPWSIVALLLSLAHPGPGRAALALLPLVVAAGVRFAVAAHLTTLLRRWSPTAERWRWLDTSLRCLLEEKKLGLAQKTDKELRETLRQSARQISDFSKKFPQAPRLRNPPRFFLLKLAALSSWALLAALLFVCVRDLRRQPPSLETLQTAWLGKRDATDSATIKEIRVDWPFKEPSDIRTISATEIRPATEAEMSQALARGKGKTQPYILSTISTPLFIRIDSDSRFAFMIYDGARDTLASEEVYILLYNPLPRTWLEIDGRRVFVPEN